VGSVGWQSQVNAADMISRESFLQRLKIFDAEPSHWEMKINFPFARIKDKSQSEAYKWCQENFGENWIWSSPIQTDYTDIYFLQLEDVLLFKLKFDTLATT
jgi:hypothetical protein